MMTRKSSQPLSISLVGWDGHSLGWVLTMSL